MRAHLRDDRCNLRKLAEIMKLEAEDVSGTASCREPRVLLQQQSPRSLHDRARVGADLYKRKPPIAFHALTQELGHEVRALGIVGCELDCAIEEQARRIAIQAVDEVIFRHAVPAI